MLGTPLASADHLSDLTELKGILCFPSWVFEDYFKCMSFYPCDGDILVCQAILLFLLHTDNLQNGVHAEEEHS